MKILIDCSIISRQVNNAKRGLANQIQNFLKAKVLNFGCRDKHGINPNNIVVGPCTESSHKTKKCWRTRMNSPLDTSNLLVCQIFLSSWWFIVLSFCDKVLSVKWSEHKLEHNLEFASSTQPSIFSFHPWYPGISNISIIFRKLMECDAFRSLVATIAASKSATFLNHHQVKYRSTNHCRRLTNICLSK